MSDYDNNLRGVLFVNHKKENAKQPDMTGSCEIDGVKYRLSAWNKVSAKNDTYMSLALSLMDAKPNGAATPQPQAQQQVALDDDVPF
jgi:hypothetical protein